MASFRSLTLLALLLLPAPVWAQSTTTGPWARVLFGAASGPFISSGTGSPEGVVTASAGSLYIRTDGGSGFTLYTKVGSGSTGWEVVGGGGGGGSHNLLSATHPDTIAGAPVAGAVLCGTTGPAWTRCSPSSTGQMFRFGGTTSAFSFDGTSLNINASNLTTGIVPDDRMPNLTGDVTTSEGAVATTIANDAVTSAKIDDGTIVFNDWSLNGCAAGQVPKINGGGTAWECGDDDDTGGGGGAPDDGSYWTATAEGGLSAEVNLGALTDGAILKIDVTAGYATPVEAVAGTDYVVPAGNVATATALAANGSNCSAGEFAAGVSASGAAEGCTALPTTIAGTANEITASASTGAVTLSLPAVIDLGGKTLEIPNSTSLPGTCAVGQIYMDTDATTGQRLYLCESANTWVLQGDGGGGGGSPGGSSGDLQINDGAGGFDAYAGDGCSLGDFVTDIAADGSVTCGTPGAGPGAEWRIFFPSMANAPPLSNPATFGSVNSTPLLEFDTTTQEIAIFLGVLPATYAGGGIQVCAHWAAASATSGTIGWDVAFERIGDGSQNLASDGFATAQTITAATVPGSAGLTDITCVTATDGANIDSLAAGELFRLRIRRDVSNDTATGDAHLVAIDLKEP